tara:strand:- start:141 stop:926 length:786 start_codon:yes stop_codon:yes gene_type:complete
MKISRALKYKYNSKYWELNFLKRIQGIQSITVLKKTYKWWNPFSNIRVCRDSMSVYGPALYYIRKHKLTKILDFGCALGMGTWLLNGDGSSCVGLESEKEKVEYCNKVFPEIKFVNGKDRDLKEKFDVIVCSYTISPRESENLKIIDHYAPICITINSNLKGIKGTRIGKYTMVSGKNIPNKTDYIFIFAFFLLRIKHFIIRVLEKRRKFISCSKCYHVLSIEDLDENKVNIKCKNCGYEDKKRVKPFEENYMGFKEQDFI